MPLQEKLYEVGLWEIDAGHLSPKNRTDPGQLNAQAKYDKYLLWFHFFDISCTVVRLTYPLQNEKLLGLSRFSMLSAFHGIGLGPPQYNHKLF